MATIRGSLESFVVSGVDGSQARRPELADVASGVIEGARPESIEYTYEAINGARVSVSIPLNHPLRFFPVDVDDPQAVAREVRLLLEAGIKHLPSGPNHP